MTLNNSRDGMGTYPRTITFSQLMKITVRTMTRNLKEDNLKVPSFKLTGPDSFTIPDR